MRKAASTRLRREYQALEKSQPAQIIARPSEDILVWHYVVHDLGQKPYLGGQYHGKLVFPKEYPLKPPPGGSDCQRILTQACVDNMRQADERDGFERDRSGDEEYCTFLTSQQCDDTIYNPQDRDLNDWESRWRKTQNIVNQEETLLDYYTSRPGRRGGPRSDPHSGPRGGPYEDDPEGEKK